MLQGPFSDQPASQTSDADSADRDEEKDDQHCGHTGPFPEHGLRCHLPDGETFYLSCALVSDMCLHMFAFYNAGFDYNKDGYTVLEQLLGLQPQFLRYRYYYQPTCTLRRLSKIVQMQEATLTHGVLLFSADFQSVWVVYSDGRIVRCCFAEVFKLIRAASVATFLVIRPPFCRKGQDFRILTPLLFPRQSMLPESGLKSLSRKFLGEGWVRVDCQRSSLDIQRHGMGEMTFRLLLPANGRKVSYFSV